MKSLTPEQDRSSTVGTYEGAIDVRLGAISPQEVHGARPRRSGSHPSDAPGNTGNGGRDLRSRLEHRGNRRTLGLIRVVDNTSTKEGDVIIRRLTSYWQVWIVTKDSSLEPDPNVDPKVEVGREAAEQTARNIAKDTGGRIFLVDQGGALSEISVPRPGDTLVVDKPNGRDPPVDRENQSGPTQQG